MVLNQDEMSDSEIIQLLSEYNFTNQEMSKILKEIPKRDFESVLSFVEEFRKDQGKWEENDREKMMEELRKRNDIQKKEAERNERYRQLLKEKIAANRQEQKIREEQENQDIKIDNPIIHEDSDVKIKVVVDNNKEIYLGFDIDATIDDLYNRIATEIGGTNFELTIFGIGKAVPVSSKPIIDEFKVKAVMLEVNRANK